MSDSALAIIVTAGLDSALENGYFAKGEYLHGATADEIADDMVAMDADCEDFTADQVLPHVRAWLENNPQ